MDYNGYWMIVFRVFSFRYDSSDVFALYVFRDLLCVWSRADKNGSETGAPFGTRIVDGEAKTF